MTNTADKDIFALTDIKDPSCENHKRDTFVCTTACWNQLSYIYYFLISNIHFAHSKPLSRTLTSSGWVPPTESSKAPAIGFRLP